MKLTTEQIANLNSYMQSFNIKWHELEVELTDHFISIIEEIWEKDHKLTFFQAKQYAENCFGENELKKLKKKELRFS